MRRHDVHRISRMFHLGGTPMSLADPISKLTEHLGSLAHEQPQIHGRGADAKPGPDVIALIPAYNEERFIASVVLTARRFATNVIVIDDGSQDRTADLAEAAGATVVRCVENGGKAEALNAGFRFARSFPSDVVVCLDADAQHEPSEIPRLIEPILLGVADVVIGSRFLEVKSTIPRWRQVGQHTLTAITNTMSGTRVTDSQSGFRAFSPAAVQALHFRTRGLGLESEMQFLFAPSGLRVAEVPISVRYLDGNKRNPIVHGIQILDSLLGLVARRRPLMFISLPGIVISCIGLLLAPLIVYRLEQTGTIMVGPALIAVLTIIGGLLLAVTGVMLHSMGHFVSRLRDEIVDLVARR
jgi:glycosyltransferase involved in cell wall biosynthesis